MKNFLSLCILLINFLVSISYFFIYSKSNLKESFFKLPMVIQKLYVGLFVLPLFISPFFAILKFLESNAYIIIFGILTATVGFSIILLSFLKIGTIPSIKSDGKLSTQGTYRIVRHPIYFGTILTQAGLILLNQAFVSLVYLPISVTLYYIMASIEEKDLITIFGQQYIDFKLKTKWKIIPFLF